MIRKVSETRSTYLYLDSENQPLSAPVRGYAHWDTDCRYYLYESGRWELLIAGDYIMVARDKELDRYVLYVKDVS